MKFESTMTAACSRRVSEHQFSLAASHGGWEIVSRVVKRVRPWTSRRALLLLCTLMLSAGCQQQGNPTTTADTATAGSAAATATTPASAPATEPPAPEVLTAREAFELLLANTDGSGSPELWNQATEKLNALGPAAAPVFVEYLKHENRLARELASTFIAQLGGDAQLATAALIEALGDSSQFVQVNSAATLSTLGKVGEQTLPVFKSALQAEELSVRTTAAASLGNLVDQGAPAVEALLLALKDAHPDVQTAAVRSLGKFGSAAAAAVPDLQQLDATAEAPLKELIAATLNRIAGAVAPAAETPAVEAPAVDAPAVDAPAVEALPEVPSP